MNFVNHGGVEIGKCIKVLQHLRSPNNSNAFTSINFLLNSLAKHYRDKALERYQSLTKQEKE